MQPGPKYDPKSEGFVEATNGIVEGLLRVYVASTEARYHLFIGSNHSLLPWLCTHVGWVLTRFAVKKDGLTAFRRLRGREYRGLLVEPLEGVLYKKQGLQASKLEVRWATGIWFGKKSDTDDHIIGTSLGQVLARTIAHRPESRRWQPELLQPVICTPWEPSSTLTPPEPTTRVRYLTRAIIERLGKTADCPAFSGTGPAHAGLPRAVGSLVEG